MKATSGYLNRPTRSEAEIVLLKMLNDIRRMTWVGVDQESMRRALKSIHDYATHELNEYHAHHDPR